MILEKEKRTFFYNCFAISGWLCIVGLFKFIAFLIYHICFKKDHMIDTCSYLLLSKALIFKVAVIATFGLMIAILLMVIESCFPLKFPSHKFLDTKIMDVIYTIGFFAECIFFMPVVIVILGVFFYSLS